MPQKVVSLKHFYFYVIIAGTLWATLGTFFRFLSEYNFSRMQIVFVRAFVSAIFLFLFLFIKDSSLLKIHLQDLWLFFGTGIVSLVFFNYCYFTAMQFTSLAIAAVLLYTAPAFVVIFSAIFFKEKLSKRKLLALVLTLAGCAVISGFFNETGNISFAGILWGLGAGLGYSLYTIFSRVALERYHSSTISFYTFLFASLGSGFICFGIEKPHFWGNSQTMFLSLGLGVVTCLLPYLFYTKGLQGIKNSEASITATIEPLVATFISVTGFGENLTIQKILGIVLILSAVVLVNLPAKKLPTDNMPQQ